MELSQAEAMTEIGFFLYAGSPPLGREFEEFLWKENGIEKYLKKELSIDFGLGLQLILVRFHIEGPFGDDLPARGLAPYKKSEMAIASNIPVRKAELEQMNIAQRAAFVAQSVQWTVDEVAKKMKSKFPGYDFSKLKEATARASIQFVRSWATE